MKQLSKFPCILHLEKDYEEVNKEKIVKNKNWSY